MDTRPSSGPRPSSYRRSLEALDDAPTLTDRDNHALEAIRRQLDQEFPHSSVTVQVVWHSNPTTSTEARAERRTSNGAMRAVTVVGALLLACAAGSGTGALIALMMLGPTEPVSPALERETPSPRPATVTPTPRRARVPVDATVTRTPPRARTAGPHAAAPATPTSRRAPGTVGGSPPTTAPLASDPPIERAAPAADEGSAATRVTPERFRSVPESP